VKTKRLPSFVLFLALSALARSVPAADIPTPESVIGFKVGGGQEARRLGADRRLFPQLDAASELA